MPNGKYRKVPFITATYGSYYQTNDKDVQKALEAHSWYGTIFKLESVSDAEVEPVEEAKEEEKEIIEVSSMVEAKDVMQARGIDVSSARSKIGIEELADKNLIKFNWVK